jgi:tRNA-2-methylthio-N6-dimethylallyladenosine synthase
MRKYFIQTFGCQMNEADSEKISMMLLQSGFMKVASWRDADLVICNTCSVRKKWEDRVYSMMNEIAKEFEKTGKRIITGITGCMIRKTGINKKYFQEIEERKKEKERAKKIEYLDSKQWVFNSDDKLFPKILNLDFTLRIEEIKYLPFILTHLYGEKIGQEDKFDDYLKLRQQRENPFSASIIIQTGCDNYCTFCIVPFTRGKEISRPMEEIIIECREVVQNGAKEITLLGQNVNSYGKQFVDKKLWNEETGKWKINPPFIKKEDEWKKEKNSSFNKGGAWKAEDLFKSPFRLLLEEISTIEWLDRIRFTSSNPHDMTQDILDAHFELPHMCNYIHFALQSWSNTLLKKMNRKHKYEDFKKIVTYLRSKDPHFAISTDMIIGFSGETEELFWETLRAFEECDFDFAYNARYSVRPGTIAAKIYPDDITDNEKATRWHRLNSQLENSVQKRNALMLGRIEEVLISGERDSQYFGRTRNFKEVFFNKSENVSPTKGDAQRAEGFNKWWEALKVGDIVKVKITEIDRWVLKGEKVL